MKYLLFLSIVVSLVFCTCKPESYEQLESRALQDFLDSCQVEKRVEELPSVYYYDILGKVRPAMSPAEIFISHRSDEHMVYEEFSAYGGAIAKTKISIVYFLKGKRIVVKEVRRSFACRRGRGHTGFGIEQYN